MDQLVTSGINGFGRFGLHLLKYWLDRLNHSNFNIKYINDDTLDINQALEIITKDKYIDFSKYEPYSEKNTLYFSNGNKKIAIEYTNNTKNNINWIGKPNFFFECSGKLSVKKDCLDFIIDNTTQVIISATCLDADQTLIYGYNHLNFKKEDKIISYGSCTVNAFIVLANYINKKYNIKNCDLNIIHNIPNYKLSENNTLKRRVCTLEKSGPILLNFIDENNFKINYTLIPYSGLSIIDYRFNVNNHIIESKFKEDLIQECLRGSLKDLYLLDLEDHGPEKYKESSYSSIIIEENIKIIGQNIYLHSYFDNENSVNRFFDLANFISNK